MTQWNSFEKLSLDKEKKLTGHLKLKRNVMGLLKPSTLTFGILRELPPSTGVMMSPKVHGDVVSILAWYILRHTWNLVLHGAVQCASLFEPSQHWPLLNLPNEFVKLFILSSNDPVDSTCNRNTPVNIYYTLYYYGSTRTLDQLPSPYLSRPSTAQVETFYKKINNRARSVRA